MEDLLILDFHSFRRKELADHVVAAMQDVSLGGRSHHQSLLSPSLSDQPLAFGVRSSPRIERRQKG